MMKSTIVVGTVLLFAMLSGAAVARSPLLITEKIDADQVISGLPLTDRQILKSGDGRKKHMWSIKGHDASKLEVVGNNPSDADQVGMHCVTFDKEGKAVSPVSPGAPCHVLFVKLLSKFTATPDSFAQKLIEDSAQSRQTENRLLDDLSLETDGEFYVVRRLSRTLRR